MNGMMKQNGSIDLSRYAVIPIWYHCNSNCTICMLSNVKQKMNTVTPEQFRTLLSRLVQDGRYDGIILSGAEITTFPHLEAYVKEIASFGWFKKIQIQTNGRRLADPLLVRKLVDAGVNEFFISLHGLEQVHEAITRVPGSFRETIAGFMNVSEYPVNIISNTVMTRANYHGIIPLLQFLASGPPHELNIWNYFPMGEHDSRDLIVSLTDVMTLFPAMITAVGPSGKPLVLKGFPECIAPGAPCYIDSNFPLNLIQDEFWYEFGKNGFASCCHREQCSSHLCLALSRAYIRKFGVEESILSPRSGGQ